MINWIIKYIRGKIAKGIGIISKAKRYLNSSCLRSLYFSFIYPYLTYCIEVWGSATRSRLNCLIVIQKKAIRIISNSGFRDHTDPLFKQLNLLTLNNIYIYQIGIFMFKNYQNVLPAAFDNMFQYNDEIHSYATRQKNQLRIPAVRSNCLYQTVRAKGVTIWNSIFLKLTVQCSIHSFKASLFKLLINEGLLTS